MKFYELSDVLPIHHQIRYEVYGINVKGIINVEDIYQSEFAIYEVLAISFEQNLVTLKALTYDVLISQRADTFDTPKTIGEKTKYNARTITARNM